MFYFNSIGEVCGGHAWEGLSRGVGQLFAYFETTQQGE